MEKDKLPPPYYPLKSDPAAAASSSSSSPSHNFQESSSNRFSHDVSQMPDFPSRSRGGHRRAQSEILSLPDDLTFDTDLGVIDGDGPSFSDEMEEDFLAMYLDMDKIGSSSAGENLMGAQDAGGAGGASSSSASVQSERPRIRHQHSQSMDGSTLIKTELLGSSSEGPQSLVEAKKAMSAAKLADLALVDPKRAKSRMDIKLKCANGKWFELDETIIMQCGTLRRMIQNNRTEVSLPNVKSCIVPKLIEYCNMHKNDALDKEQLRQWDSNFVKALNQSTLIHLVYAASYLEIKGLLHLTCWPVADICEDIKEELEEERSRSYFQNIHLIILCVVFLSLLVVVIFCTHK